MLIPGAMIRNLIREREQTQQTVISEIGSKWGGGQTLTGPVLSIPYYQVVKTEERTYKELRHAHFLPAQLDLDVRVDPEIRYRGIYKSYSNRIVKIMNIFIGITTNICTNCPRNKCSIKCSLYTIN